MHFEEIRSEGEGTDFRASFWIMAITLAVTVAFLVFVGFGVRKVHAKLSLTGEYVALINVLRPKIPVYERKDLTRIAEARAKFLCGKKLSHEGFYAALFDNTPYSYLGENLAEGFPTVKATHEAWIKSPSHRDNILGKQYRYVGVGTACGRTVELFGGIS